MDILDQLRINSEEDISNRQRIAEIIYDALVDRPDKFSNPTILAEAEGNVIMVEFKRKCYAIEVWPA